MKKSSKIIFVIIIILLLITIGVGGIILSSNLKKSNEKVGELENQIKNAGQKEVEIKNEEDNNKSSIDETKLIDTINSALVNIAKKDDSNAQKYYAKYFELGRKLEGNTLDVYVWAQYGAANQNNTEESGTSLPLKLRISLDNYKTISNDVPPEDTYYPKYFPEIANKLTELDGKINDSLFGKTYYENNNNVTNTDTQNKLSTNTDKAIDYSKLNGEYTRVPAYETAPATLTITEASEKTLKFDISASSIRVNAGESIQSVIDRGAVNIGGYEGIATKISENKWKCINTEDMESLGKYEIILTLNNDNTIQIETKYDEQYGNVYCGFGVTLEGTYKK